MKYLKQKLMAAAAMLMVSVVMLTSASYAWFTISVTPEVTDITTTITANENFEIALGTDETAKPNDTEYDDGATDTATNKRAKDQTWGATITSLDDLEGLGPAEVNSNVIQTVEYGEDGRPKAKVAADRAIAGETTDTEFDNGTADIKDKEGNIIGQTILVWLRTNVTGDVTVEVSGVEFTVDSEDRSQIVKTAFEVCTFGTEVTKGTTIVVAGDPDAEGVRSAELGEFEKNTEIPVLIHVYLDGEEIKNSDVADGTNSVVIGKIEFINDEVGGDASYKHTDQNPATP